MGTLTDMFSHPLSLICGLVAFVTAVTATPLVRAGARRIGVVALPKKDRWHSKPTAMMGGVAIYIAVIFTLLTVQPQGPKTRIVIATSSALFVLGLIDDLLHMKPYQKLIGQLLSSAVVVYFGIVLPWTQWQLVNILVTIFWLVGITNAVNMLDNMDGLAAGVSAIAALFLAINFFSSGSIVESGMLLAFAGGLAGFLVYNFNPASIFMGDCGSMFVGFFLASTALLSNGGGRSRSMMAVLAVPVLTLLIPIFDTTFVTVARKLAGRSASKGGRDHTSHRLVALGLTERHAVLMLYAAATVCGLLSVAVQKLTVDVSIAIIAIFSVILTIMAVYLGNVRVYDEPEFAQAQAKPIVGFLINLSYKRRAFEVLLDVVLIVVSYYLAYALRFGPMANTPDWQLFLETVPIVLFMNLAVFLAAGVYRGLWRYTSLPDLFVFVRAVAGGSVLSVLVILYAFRFTGFSRAVFVLDALILFFFVSITRLAFRVIRRLLPVQNARTGRRVLIYGAGDGGELLIRELKSNSSLQYVVVGLLDDDPQKAGKVIHGFVVHGGEDKLRETCIANHVEAILLSSRKVSENRLRQIANHCSELGIELRRMHIDITPITNSDLGLDVHPSLRSAHSSNPVSPPEPQVS